MTDSIDRDNSDKPSVADEAHEVRADNDGPGTQNTEQPEAASDDRVKTTNTRVDVSPTDDAGDGGTEKSVQGGSTDVVVTRQAHTLPEAKEITKARVRDLRGLITRYGRKHLPPRAPAPKPSPAPPRPEGAHARLLPLLRLFPILLGIGFGVSFVWDFPDAAIRVLGLELELAGMLRIVSVSGLIGFLTNWLAITMLFNPRNRRPIFGQGLIPSQRQRVIYRLAKAVSEELINEQIIKQKIEESQVIPRYRELALSVTRGVIEDPDFRTDLKLLTTQYLDEVVASEDVRKRIVEFTIDKIEQEIGQGLSGLALKVYRFLNEDEFQRRLDQSIRELPASLDAVLDDMDDLLDRLPEKIEARSEEIEEWATRIILGFVENLDVYSMIVENMSNYDEQQLENLIKGSTNEQLNYIKYLGGVLGCIGGLVIWHPVYALTAFALTGGVLVLIDQTIYKFRKGAG
ncbi:MAG: DUF445 domain-containing protein [Rhodothermia bacterium]|nr:DUF445 domain-containing protein [Rhodothermia bacterium]